MSELLFYLFDDRRARRWAPFTLTRPAAEVRYGCLTFRERSEHVLGLGCAGILTREALAGFDEPDACPVVPASEVPSDAPRMLLCSRVALSFDQPPPLDRPGRLTLRGRTVGWVLAAGESLPEDHRLQAPERDTDGTDIPIAGELVDRPWHVVAGTPDRVAADIDALHRFQDHPEGVVRIGTGEVSLADDAVIEPGVVLDTRGGPIRLDAGARVEGPARLTGPLYLGRDTTVLGGSVGTSSIGPVCKIRGEVTDSVLLGWVNKAHEGHLGHALVGQWVNLGAGTNNSDLKNNYGTVRVWTLDGAADTGLVKVGCYLGDHVKTGIGVIINTGTVVGAGSNVFGAPMPPSVVPPFSWGTGVDLRDYRIDKFMEVAERAMARRGRELTPGVRRILSEAWDATRTRRAQ